MENSVAVENQQALSFEEFKTEVLNDYRIAYESRQTSLLGRKEVLTGKAKFGIFGDGKEIAQIAMAKAFKKGDIRTGYYRDQTFMFATGMSDVTEFFAQLYANTNVEEEPASAGRQMNAHFGTRFLNPDGSWKKLTSEKQSTADISPTAGHMGRSLGVAYASKLYRQNAQLHDFTTFSNKGNEVSFCTIGNASTSEGHFWEVLNAAGVLQVPLAISVWDDGYGISVPSKYQTTKENISELLRGFHSNEDEEGYKIYTAKGWDYPRLVEMYLKGISHCRNTHQPCVFHIQEMTQPQGHSTSGSHERYKSKERLAWEDEFDCIAKMREWIVSNGIGTDEELEELEKGAIDYVKNCKRKAWKDYRKSIQEEIKTVTKLLENLAKESLNGVFIEKLKNDFSQSIEPIRRDVMSTVRQALRIARNDKTTAKQMLLAWKNEADKVNKDRFNDYLYSESENAALKIPAIKAKFSDDAPSLNGYEILNKCFEANFEKYPELFAIGEDVGKIGDVNQGFMNLQKKFGELRVTDTGIREMSIMGQGIGAAIRGLRPIVEIQYLDYLLYGLQILSDDLATVQYRSKGGQKAPVIVRTRGHRLEGIWHSGSPMGMVIHALRGINILVPRNMVQAAGMYNTMLQSDEPALIVECLNAYRLKENLPENIGEFRVPLGIPETILEGTDVTIVTYGSCCRIAEKAAKQLQETGISIEIIDVQTLLPFDVNHQIVESLKKTNRVLFLDEDVPGGASAYMMQEVLENQGGYFHLDSQPKTLTSKAHRPAYASDGDYFSKPSAEDVVEAVYEIMHDSDPDAFPRYL